MLSFVDACDKIKISMHLHSFTYDFHLRCIHSYIAGTGPWLVQQGYHLIHFLDDFNKYYSKAPNYARNLIYNGKWNYMKYVYVYFLIILNKLFDRMLTLIINIIQKIIYWNIFNKNNNFTKI